jgi:hypothetical protein
VSEHRVELAQAVDLRPNLRDVASEVGGQQLISQSYLLSLAWVAN